MDELEELREQVRRLTARVHALERGERPPAPPPERRAEPEAPAPTPSPRALEPRRARAPRDLETTLGARWLAALGTLVLVLGAAFFVVYFLGEAAQIGVGVLGGLALVGAGEILHRRARYGAFPHYLVAGGVAIVYFAVFAAYRFEEYRAATGMTLTVDALLLGAVAAGNIALALRYDDRAIAAEGFTLGYATVLLAGSVEPDGTIAFLALAYVALLAGTLLAVVAARRWVAIGIGGAVATWLALAFLRPVLDAYALAYGLTVALVAVELWVLAVRSPGEGAPGRVVGALASLGASTLFWWNLDRAAPAAADDALAILALVHLAASFALPSALRPVSGLAAAILAFVWAPVAFDDAIVTILWAAFALVLAALALPRALGWARLAALGGCALVFVRVFFHDPSEWIARDPTSVLGLVATGSGVAALAGAYVLAAAPTEVPSPERLLGNRFLLALAVLAPLPYLATRLDGTFVTISWAFEGFLLVGGGFALERASASASGAGARRDLRLAGVGVLLLVFARVMLFDLATLDLAWRVVVFLATGTLLLAAAFLFARGRGGESGDNKP